MRVSEPQHPVLDSVGSVCRCIVQGEIWRQEEIVYHGLAASIDPLQCPQVCINDYTASLPVLVCGGVQMGLDSFSPPESFGRTADLSKFKAAKRLVTNFRRC